MEKAKVTLDHFYHWYLDNKEKLLESAEKINRRNHKLKQEFLKEWPLERLSTMTIDEYVIGKGSGNKSLCYEIEQGKYSELYLSIKGGSSGKFGIYYSKKYNGYCDQGNNLISSEELEEKFLKLKMDLVAIIKAGINHDYDNQVFSYQNSFYNRSSITIKLLCIYSPSSDFFGVNISTNQSKFWGQLMPLDKKHGGVYKQNYELTATISKKFPELDGNYLSSILWEYHRHMIDSKKEKNNDIEAFVEENSEDTIYLNAYSNHLLEAKNIIFRGAPGTGKTYLAKEIAADIVSKGRTTSISELEDDEKKRIGFVQFHPSYDYTDFVEGLRPVTSDDGDINFQLKAGSFMSFINQAKAIKSIDGVDNFDEAWEKFFDAVAEASIEGQGYHKLLSLTGKPIKNLLTYERGGVQGVYPEGTTMYWNHDQIYNIYRGLPGVPKEGLDNYRKAIINHLKSEYGLNDYQEVSQLKESDEDYVFIIDEINRGEISKIFGELFYSLDPDYRGNKEGVYTQYANLHANPEEKFYIPENVFIIGTMNDIDRSVDTFDFAMRRRFTFLEITAEASAEKMNLPVAVKQQMARLNDAIVAIGGLTEDYHIGASYFKDSVSPEVDENDAPLWQTKIQPLLKDYFRGEHKASDKLEELKKEYFSVEED
ncbi:McrB family protein [Streptococcus zalophi]|uniref:McrB family protein n=1 Tax=Streptococcus zalophi TaxID=640031 RepID=UPI00215CCBE2|nr:AAA family ATPase [Streptococcus zalophi]MCR8966991.1 AAA family ATPase [Streptococcus zalophi]